ncbi:MAG TPA: hypothetical protein VNS58_00830 [Puia sp.]|nr:hypothetical protein [Puia sp.]
MKFVCFCLFLLFNSCNIKSDRSNSGKKSADKFYTDQGDWDDSRIPLIKPYELIRLKGDSQWIMSLFTTSINVSITNVIEVNVLDSIIIVHSGETNFIGGVNPKEAWFIVLANTKIEKGFTKRRDFEKELLAMHVGNAFFIKANSVYSSFTKNKIIKWKTLK